MNNDLPPRFLTRNQESGIVESGLEYPITKYGGPGGRAK